MPLHLENLDDRTRHFMLDEFERDRRAGTLYLSPRLSARGRADYPSLLRAALASGDGASLARSLNAQRRMSARELRQKRSGAVVVARVPARAHEMLAADEFNRYYKRGLCRRALADGIRELVVYRARKARAPRPESEAALGVRVDPEILLDDLRTSQGVDPAFGLPGGSNSGISVRLP